MPGGILLCQMKIIFRNVRGLGGVIRRLVKALLRRRKVQLSLLHEMKLKGINGRMVKKIWGRKNISWVGADADGSSGGILILWNKRYV